MNIQLTPEEPLCASQYDNCSRRGDCLRYYTQPFTDHIYSYFTIGDDGICNGYLTEEDFENADQEPEPT